MAKLPQEIEVQVTGLEPFRTILTLIADNIGDMPDYLVDAIKMISGDDVFSVHFKDLKGDGVDLKGVLSHVNGVECTEFISANKINKTVTYFDKSVNKISTIKPDSFKLLDDNDVYLEW